MVQRIVIENCAIATVDAADTEYASGHVVIAGNRIESVGAGRAPEGLADVVRRIDALRGRMSFMRARAFGDADDADELDRLAWLSARVVQLTVLWLGRHVPGTRALLAAAHRGLDRLRGRGGRP